MSISPNSHYRDPNTNRNRRRKLKDRLKNLIDKSDMTGGQKCFLKESLMPLMQEYAELWECRTPLSQMEVKNAS